MIAKVQGKLIGPLVWGRMTGIDLKMWRQSMGWTQKEAAKRLRTPFYSYRQYERGKTRIPGVFTIATSALSVMKFKAD